MLRLLWWLSESKNAIYFAGSLVLLASVIAVIGIKMGNENQIPSTIQAGIVAALVSLGISALGKRIKANYHTTNQHQ